MKKRILTLVLALAMLLTSIPSAMAAKKNYEDEPDEDFNIYAWGGFEDANSVKQLSFVGGATSATLSLVNGGANGTEHCLEYDATKGTYLDLMFPFIGIVGESYKFSFYAKSQNGATSILTIIGNLNGGTWTYLPAATITSEGWTKYDVTFTWDGVNTRGQGGLTMKSLQFRFGPTSGGLADVYYIDEICIIPEGIFDTDYSSVNAGYTLGGEVEVEEEVVDSGVITKPDVTFTDIQNHWAKNTIETLAKYEYVAGMGDGTFAPDSDVTRAQFIKMLVDGYDLIAPKYDGRFADVKGDEWYVGYLMLADKLKLLDDALKADGNIYPDRPITREEAATIAAKVAKEKGAEAKTTNKTSFTDDASISSWAASDVRDAASYGLIKGYETGAYQPKSKITRAEASAILSRVVDLDTRLAIYVDAQNGNDKADGSEAAPLKTLEAARNMAKKTSSNMKNDTTIFLRGEFRLQSTFKLDETHSGTNGYSIIYTSWGKEKPVLTMADEYSNWQLHDANLNIYKTYVGRGTTARQAYFNNIKGIRARNIGYLENDDYIFNSHYECDNKELLDFKYPTDLEFVYHILWCNNRFKVESISETEEGRVRIDMSPWFYQYNTRVNFDGDANTWRQCPSYIENAYELLDEEGEFYMNQHDGYMYYIPRRFEDMNNMSVKIPKDELMIDARGKIDAPLTNITFDNILFEGTKWEKVDRDGGLCDAQNNHIRESSDRAPDSAITFANATGINFTNNLCRQMGIIAIMFQTGVKHSNIIGNEFTDIGGTAIYVDAVEQGGTFAERPKHTWCEYLKVNNNYIHTVAYEYESSAAIWLGFVRHTESNHNEIGDVPYSGYNVNYGWANYASTGTILYDVEVNYNYIHDVMKDRVADGASIYTLGASSLECEKTNIEKNNRIWGNYLTNGWMCDNIYPDEGSTSWYVKNNVCQNQLVEDKEYNFIANPYRPKDGQYFMHMHASSIMWITTEENWSDLDYAYKAGMMNMLESNIDPVNLYPDGNFPPEAQYFIDNAGIEPEYRDNFDLHGAKVFMTPEKWFTVSVGETFPSKLLVLGGKDDQLDVKDFYIDWVCEEDAVTYDQATNTFTTHKAGIWEAEAFAVIDGTLQHVHFRFDVGGEITSLDMGGNSIQMIGGYTKQLAVKTISDIGVSFDVTNDESSIFDLSVADTSIATFDNETRIITANKETGSTTLKGTITYRDKVFEIDMPIVVINYSSKEAESLPYRIIDFSTAAWKNTPVSQSDGGALVYGKPNHTGERFANELLAFDVSINPGHTWPTIAFCDSDNMGSYSTNDCYMVGFKEDHIEIQRFNKGERTMIFGNDFNPIGGPGIPTVDGDRTIFEYNKRYSIVMGALDTEEGTRLILTINGENIIDYMDTGAFALESRGHYVVYNPEPGGMTFYPYSGITNK